MKTLAGEASTSRGDAAVELARQLAALLGPGGVLEEPTDTAPFARDLIGVHTGRPAFVVRPRSTEEVAEVLRRCAARGVGVVPAGGGTGFCGGAVPDASGREVVLSLARMARVRDVDLLNNAITVDAGCPLAEVQRVAAGHDRLFALSHGGEGSSQIGGNIATNAGGNAVIRYGSMRDLLLGLEVVLADGRILDCLRGLRKDNSGYDLKQLFVGSEGTLGIVTAAVLKLAPRPRQSRTALVAVGSPQAAVDLLGRFNSAAGEAISAFELIPRSGLDLALSNAGCADDPFGARHPWQVLVELESTSRYFDLAGALEDVLGGAIADGTARDAVIAQSDAQRRRLWALREALAMAQVADPSNLKNDTSVPISRIPEFIERAGAEAARIAPGVRAIPFGHVGDGNIHFNLSRPLDLSPEAFVALWPRLIEATERVALALGGSISAEHGIGQLKRATLYAIKSPVEIDVMEALKRAMDPDGLLNPGKVLRAV